MALVETSTFCHEHAWIGKVPSKCPKCQARKQAAKFRWQKMSIEERVEYLRQHVLGTEY